MPGDEWERLEPIEGDDDDEDDFEAEATGVVNLYDLMPSKKPARPFLMVLAGDNTGHMQRVGDGVTVGRSAKADLRVPAAGASRLHARVFVEGGVTYIEDLGSANGTWVNGERVSAKVPMTDGDKIQIGATCMLKLSFQDDVEEKFQRGLYEAARRDGLTKAFNKKALTDHLNSELAFADRHQTLLTLIMFDLDHFKNVNDTYGHLAGDHVLRVVAEIVTAAIRTEDFFARYGGEEFCVVCRGVTADQTAILGQRLRASIEHRTFTFEDSMIPVTISLGIALFPQPGIQNPAGLISAADGALYEAKRKGRNCLVVHSPSAG